MKKPFVISLLALSVLLFSSLSYAKSYSVESIRIDAIVGSDGLIRVREQIAYDFQGEFSYAYRDIPLKPGEELVDVGVGEGGVEFERSEKRSFRTYSVSRIDDGGVRITWYYSAKNEEKTFALDYTVVGAVKRYEDVADCYWKVIEDEHEPVSQAFVDIALPDSSPGLFKV